jgi:predicted HTH domain antitoxin
MDLNQLVTFINLHGGTDGMATNGLSSALTLYGARTLTLSQAAAQAGLSEAEFIEQLERRGIEVTESERAAALDAESTVRAD